MQVLAQGVSDVGMKREENQDSFLIDEGIGLFMVADGMGGHAGGEIASQLAVDTVAQVLRGAAEASPELFQGEESLEGAVLADRVREAVEAASYAIYHRARAEPSLSGMGTTVCAMVMRPSQETQRLDCVLGHVGDSRVYIYRRGKIQQITEDHSVVNEQIKAGVITPEEAKTSRYRNIITRSVGFEEDVLVDVLGWWAEAGDVYLICSDGLTNFVDTDELAELVEGEGEGEAVVSRLPKRLVDLANERGGDDNITVVAVQVAEGRR